MRKFRESMGDEVFLSNLVCCVYLKQVGKLYFRDVGSYKKFVSIMEHMLLAGKIMCE